MEIKRLCIYLGNKCNLNCKYCMRKNVLRYDWPDISMPTEKVKRFLGTRSKTNCDALIVTGGEPLIYFDRVKSVFSSVKPEVHKKIITNGTLLTPEIVAYCNRNNIEVNLSHDGEVTEYTRGVDVLKNTQLLKLIKEIKKLTISYVVTNINCDIYRNYIHIRNILERNVYITLSVISETGYNDDLIKNFDYELFNKSYLDYMMSDCFVVPSYYIREDRSKVRGINMTLDGIMIDTTTLRPLGCTIDDTFGTAVSKLKNIAQPCPIDTCHLKAYCCVQAQLRTSHMCKAEQVLIRTSNYLTKGMK